MRDGKMALGRNDMNDLKNIVIAWLSAGSPVVAAVLSEPGLTILSALILPIVFFALGKTIDVFVQIHFRRAAQNANNKKEEVP